MQRQPHAIRAEIDVQRRMLGIVMREVPAAKNRRCRCVRDGRRVNVAETVGSRRRPEIVEPTITAEMRAGWTSSAKVAESTRGERREPCVETERAGVEYAARCAVEHRHRTI